MIADYHFTQCQERLSKTSCTDHLETGVLAIDIVVPRSGPRSNSTAFEFSPDVFAANTMTFGVSEQSL